LFLNGELPKHDTAAPARARQGLKNSRFVAVLNDSKINHGERKGDYPRIARIFMEPFFMEPFSFTLSHALGWRNADFQGCLARASPPDLGGAERCF
jgi:hypothetical protein